jgi:hypothetical protein
MSRKSRTETHKTPFGMQAELFKALRPANCLLPEIYHSRNQFSICNSRRSGVEPRIAPRFTG